MQSKLRREHFGWKTYLILLSVILVQICFIVYQVTQKNGYHIDEIYSFGLSNSYDRAFLNADNAAQNHWIDSKYFDDYLTVQSDERFSYDSVYKNQVQDVHPPLYYMALHTISSFFPDQFSKWPAEILNIVFFTIIQVFLFLLSMRIFRKDAVLSLSVVILYGCSMIAIDTIVFIRMYAMLTMWTVISFYLHIRLMEENSRLRHLVPIFLVTFFGCLTHYYFLVLSFFLALISCTNFILKKRFKSGLVYAVGMILSVSAMIGYFPSVVEHLFGNRLVGNQTLHNVQDSLGAMRRFSSFAVQTIFGFLGTKYIFVLTLLLFLCLFSMAIFKILKDKKSDLLKATIKINMSSVYVSICILLTFLVISVIAFDAYSRYVYFIMPIIALCVIAAAQVLATLARINVKRFGAITLSVVIFIASYNFVFRSSSYLFNDAYVNAKIVSGYKDNYGILFCEDNSNPVLTSESISLREIKGLYCTNESNARNFRSIVLGKDIDDGMVIWIDTNKYWSSGYDAEQIIGTILNVSGFTQSKLLYETGLAEVYYVD